MFTLEEQGYIFDARQAPVERRIAFFTSLCRLRSGVFLCGFQNGPAKHAPTSTVRLCRSLDDGRTWQPLSATLATEVTGVPGSIGAAELIEAAPGRLLMLATWFDRSDPERPLFDPVTEGILKSKQLLSVSRDDGATWSDWRELSTGDLRGCALTGPLVRGSDGTLAFPFESFKEFDDPRPGRHAAWVLVSRDAGETFSAPILVAQHPSHEVYYWDQRWCAGPRPGEFTALFWTHDLAAKQDLTVHQRHAKLEGDQVVGPTVQATSLPGQIAAPVRIAERRLAAFVVDRGHPGTMTLWHSSDLGKTWPTEQRLIVHTHDERAAVTQGRENIDFKQYWEDMGKWSFGHPAIQPLDPEHLLLAWYAGTPDCMSVHWARVHFDKESLV